MPGRQRRGGHVPMFPACREEFAAIGAGSAARPAHATPPGGALQIAVLLEFGPARPQFGVELVEVDIGGLDAREDLVLFLADGMCSAT